MLLFFLISSIQFPKSLLFILTINKIQTPGGAFFQRDSVCTIATFAPYEPIFGNGDIEYSSRKHTPDGPFNNASGKLKNENPLIYVYFCILFPISFVNQNKLLTYFFFTGVLEAQDENRNGYFRQQLYINGIPTPKVDYR